MTKGPKTKGEYRPTAPPQRPKAPSDVRAPKKPSAYRPAAKRDRD